MSGLFTIILLAQFLDAIIAWKTIRVSASSWLEWRGRYSDVVSFVVIMALSFSPPVRNTVSPLVSKLKKIKTKFLRCTGYLNSIKTHIKQDLLQILVLVRQQNFLNC